MSPALCAVIAMRELREKVMVLKKILLAACAAATLVSGAASAQPGWVPPGNDPNGYYSDADHNGFYDRDGRYRRIRDRGWRRDRDDYGPPPPPAPAAYYEQGRYEESCRRGNAVNGTIFGALAGGLLGGVASRGNAGATIGGVVVGGLLGNVIGRDIDCDDQPVAYRTYAAGLNGDIGRPYEWHNRQSRHLYFGARIPPRRRGVPRFHRDQLARRAEFYPLRHGLS